MTVTATVVLAVDDGPLGGPVPFGTSFVDSLVGRLHAEYGADRHEIRRLAMEVLGTFATARVQAFIPILVEKRLRETYRALRDRGGTLGPAGGSGTSGWIRWSPSPVSPAVRLVPAEVRALRGYRRLCLVKDLVAGRTPAA